MNDEEVAFRVVRLYFEEIARLGFKRTLDLDQIINAYFYSLKRLENKEEAMKIAVKRIIEEEKTNPKNTFTTTTTVTEETNTVPTQPVVVKETTTTTETKPSKTIMDIIEESK